MISSTPVCFCPLCGSLANLYPERWGWFYWCTSKPQANFDDLWDTYGGTKERPGFVYRDIDIIPHELTGPLRNTILDAATDFSKIKGGTNG